MDMVICCLAGEIQNIMQVLEITHLHIPRKTCRLAALHTVPETVNHRCWYFWQGLSSFVLQLCPLWLRSSSIDLPAPFSLDYAGFRTRMCLTITKDTPEMVVRGSH